MSQRVRTTEPTLPADPPDEDIGDDRDADEVADRDEDWFWSRSA